MLAEGVGKRFEQLNDKLGKVQDTTTTTMAALLQEQEEARAWRKEVLEAIDKLRRQHKRTDVDQ
jgi:type IV secretory pathway VirB4 component